MTEAEWRACTDPGRMLTFLGDNLSERKRRLFGCACCRTVWELMPDARSRRAVEVAERLADGLATGDEVEAAVAGAEAVESDPRVRLPGDVCWHAAVAASAPSQHGRVSPAWVHAAVAAEGRRLSEVDDDPELLEYWAIEIAGGYGPLGWTDTDHRAPLAALLRDVAGDPFRPVAVDPAWLTSTVVGLAEAMYDRRTFHDLPVLADALQDAGCDDADILEHCRGDGPHVRGCWVVDLVLGKR